MTEQEFKNLLDKYLQGTASQEELKLIEAYEELAVKGSKDKAFESNNDKKILNREIKKTVLTKIIGVKKAKKQWLKIAVSITVIAATTVWGVCFRERPDIYINETARFMEVELPDGSQVILNSKANLQYQLKRDGVRFVTLKGEAFFDVARDEESPFVVRTCDIRTKVLGTSFNIRSTDSIIDISVATGLVQVASSTESVQLRPNQKLTYNARTQMMQKDSVDHNLYTSWHRTSIKLDRVRMVDLARILESRYGLRVYFEDAMAKEQTMTIAIDRDDRIEDVIKNINFISKLSLTKNQNNEIKVQLKR
ncbi:MAG: hypothetical protein CMH46_06440 [Muricauda sp.]|nr:MULTISPECIES: FecR family protein [unclassified Allomuricauda]MAU15164.1 hypothetical protein [Allomuricauda sp.]|tara:strand:- start:1570 stop:2493 length:924 start_codon:yes stop_codon:yes gene_type:complete